MSGRNTIIYSCVSSPVNCKPTFAHPCLCCTPGKGELKLQVGSEFLPADLKMERFSWMMQAEAMQ